MTGSLADLPATEAVARLTRGEITSEALTAECLDRIAARDGALGAFEHLDPAAALAAARVIDRLDPKPPLAGLPVAVKDIFDTADLPTERGSAAFRGRRPAEDAEVDRAAARGGRRRPREDRDDRARLLPAGEDPQPPRPGAHPRRLLERLRRRGGGAARAGRDRQPDRRDR